MFNLLFALLALLGGLEEVSAAVCQAGYYTKATTIASSVPGQSITLDACTLCPAGKACALGSVGSPEQCGAGTYAPAGSLACLPCPTGHICHPGPDAVPTLCAVGTVPNTDKTACLGCSAGSACPGPDKAVETCATTAYYSLSGAVECTPCPGGQACTANDVAGSACPSNSISAFGVGTCAVIPATSFAP